MRYIDHPDFDLDSRAFRVECGLMRLYGKSAAPAAPDYLGAAEKTAAGNLEAAKYATKANRVNQYTPYGSLTYKENGDGTWEQNQTLTPQAQATLDKQMALSDKYADTAAQGFDKIQGLLSNPQLDMSGFGMENIPSRAIDVGKTAQEAIMSRLQPQLAQQDEALRTRLANQGITLGSDAYGKEMTAQGQRGNDLQLQAALQGISLDQANRASALQERAGALQEQAYLQDRPLNLVNALRSGAQVQSPQFQGYAQQGQTQGANYLGAAQSQYQAGMDATNAANAETSGMMSGLFGIGMGLAGMPGAGGSIMQGAKGLFR